MVCGDDVEDDFCAARRMLGSDRPKRQGRERLGRADKRSLATQAPVSNEAENMIRGAGGP